LLRQVLGLSCFTVDPYQIGYHNEEAIESGAFWFYRKLGFRPLRPELRRLVEKEEEKSVPRPGIARRRERCGGLPPGMSFGSFRVRPPALGTTSIFASWRTMPYAMPQPPAVSISR
jgi:hypothetical protein